jgi:membrane protein
MAAIREAQAAVARAQRSGLGRFLACWSAVQADDQAALIAFTLLFSLFPLIGGLLTLLGFIFHDPATLERVVSAVQQRFPTQLDDLLSFIGETRQISGLLGLVSLIGLLWSGSAVFGTIAKAFNAMYGLPERGLVQQKLMSFAMIFVLLGLILVTIGASSLATALVGHSVASLPGLGLAQVVLGWALSIGSAMLMFLALYLVVPNARLRLGQVWLGALAAALLFVLLSQLFPLYLRFFGGGFAAYKTLGLFLLLMTWFYFTARIIVFGCLLNAFLRPLPGAKEAGEPVDGPAAAGRRPTGGGRLRRFGAALLETGVVLGLLLAAQRFGRRSHG